MTLQLKSTVLKTATPPKELQPNDLKWICDTKVFDFESTEKIKPIEGIVGQERALKALKPKRNLIM